MTGDLVFLQSTARSGSTWLGDMLGHHSKVSHFGEILHPDLFVGGYYAYCVAQVQERPESILPDNQVRLFAAYLDTLKGADTIALADLKLDHLEQIPFLATAIYRPEHKFVLLRRMNLLRQAISELIMWERIRQGDREVHKSHKPEKLMITVSPELVLDMMGSKAAITRRYWDYVAFSKAPYVSIAYEDLCSAKGRRAAFANLRELLGLHNLPLRSDLVRQNPQPTEELVTNWSELREAVEGSNFAYTLYLPK